MDTSKLTSCLENFAQIDGTIEKETQIESTIQEQEQINSDLSMLNIVTNNYEGEDTDNIELNVDNTTRKISANIKPIQYASKLNFPNVGSEKLIYVDIDENATYRWDNELLKYICVGRDFSEIGIISGGEA